MTKLFGIVEQRHHPGTRGAGGRDESASQIGERDLVTLVEGGSLALAMVGEDDEVIRTGRGRGHALQLSHDRVDRGQNRERVVTRDDLLLDVWHYKSANVETRTVDIHIVGLRRKVEPNPAQPTLIQTVRGKGYRWFN